MYGAGEGEATRVDLQLSNACICGSYARKGERKHPPVVGAKLAVRFLARRGNVDVRLKGVYTTKNPRGEQWNARVQIRRCRSRGK